MFSCFFTATFIVLSKLTLTVFLKVSSYILTRFSGRGHTQPSSPMSSTLADSSFNSSLQIYWQLLKIFTALLPFPLGFWACNLPTHSPDHLSKSFPLSLFYFCPHLVLSLFKRKDACSICEWDRLINVNRIKGDREREQ